MKIVAHVTTLHPRTDTRIFLKEARTLADRFPAHRVVLVVADGLGDVEGSSREVAVRDVGRLPEGRFGRAFHGITRTVAALREIEADVVHIHDPELLPVAFAMKASGRTVVYDLHENTPDLALHRTWIPHGLRQAISWSLALLEAAAAASFDLLVVATPRIARRFPERRTILVQNFPMVSELDDGERVPYAHRPPSFAYVGALSPERGAVEMLEGLGRSGNDGTLELAGVIGPSSLCEQLQGMGEWSRVRYQGVIDRPALSDLLGRVRAGIVLFHPLPNHVEAQPTKMFEYMSAGLPVIASDFPHWRSVIEAEGCGLLMDPLDPEAIGGALRWILDHPEEAAEMGRRGRAAVRARYSWEAQRVALVEAYERLLGTPASESRNWSSLS